MDNVLVSIIKKRLPFSKISYEYAEQSKLNLMCNDKL